MARPKAVAIHDQTGHPQPAGTIGMDASIGEPRLIGRGRGPRLADVFCCRIVRGGRAPWVVIDSRPDNVAAYRPCRNAGFSDVGPRTSIYASVILMARDAAAPRGRAAAEAEV